MGRGTRASGAFHPLDDDDFEELERIGAVSLSAKARAQLNSTLTKLCSIHGDRLIAREHKAAAAALRKLQRQLSQALETIATMDAEAREGMRLAKFELFPADRIEQFGERRLTGASLLQFQSAASLQSSIAELARLAQRAEQALTLPGRGGQPKVWITYVVFAVAEAFESAGGRASTAWQDHLGKRDSRFLRVLRAVHRRLPASRRVAPASRLESVARTAMARWKMDKANKSQASQQ